MEVVIKNIDDNLLHEVYEAFVQLKNYNSSLHFDKGDIDGFNRRKTSELFSYIKKGNAYIYGAFDADNLVGFIWGYPRMFFEEKRVFINSLVVAKEYEKKGIGKLLINKLADYARNELKCEALDVMVGDANNNAVDFYKHLGFKTERLQMRISLNNL